MTSADYSSKINVTGQNFAGFPSMSNFNAGSEPKTSHGTRPLNSRAKQIQQLRNSMSHHIHKDKINNPFSKTQQNFGVLLKGIKAGKSVPRQSVELKTPVSSKNEGFSSHQAFKTKGSKMPTIQVKDEGIMTSNSQIQSSHMSPRVKAISSALEKHAVSTYLDNNQFDGNKLTQQQISLFKTKMKLREASTYVTSPKTGQLSNSVLSPETRMQSLLSPTSTGTKQEDFLASIGEQLKPSSSVSCQQSIIKQLKEQQRAKQHSQLTQYEGLSIDKNKILSDPAAYFKEQPYDSKLKIQQGVMKKPQVSIGASYPRSNDISARPSIETMLQSFNCDFGINYKEISDAGKALNEGQEQLMNKKTGKNCDINVLETWINETLQEAEYFGIPGVLKKLKPGEGPSAGGRQATSTEYGIDRLTLLNTGISNENIDKLYRSFFVTSVGLFQQMKTIVQQQADSLKLKRSNAIPFSDNKVTSPKNDDAAPSVDNKKKHLSKASLLSSLWRVYTVLIEYTYSHDYKMQIQLMQEENLEQINAQSKQINQIMIDNDEKLRLYRDQIKDLTDDLKLSQEQLRWAENEMRKTQCELQKNQKQSEEEVIMRMKFEEKMNQLHSLNRTFHLASVDYKNKMEDMEFDTLNLRDKKDELEKFLQQSNADKEELQQWKNVNAKKLKLVETELKECKEQLMVQKVELDKEIHQNAENLKLIRDQENILSEDKDKIDNFLKSLSTKNLVETNIRKITEKQQNTITEINKQVISQLNEISVLKQDLSLEKERHEKAKQDILNQESKVNTCDTQIQQKDRRISYLENEVKFFEAQFTFTKSQIQRNYDVQEKQSSDIQDLNDHRLENLEMIKKLKENIGILDQKVIDLTSIESSLKEQNQRLEADRQHLSEVYQETKKLATQKRLELDGLKKSSGDKIEFLEKKTSVLESKTATLQSTLVLEERKCQNQHEKLQQNRQQISQMTNKISLLECDVSTKNEELEQLQGFNNRLVELNNNYLTSSEKMKKNLATADQTNKYFEEEKRKEIKRIEDTFDKFKAGVDRDQMIVEDVLSQHMRLIEKSLIHQQQKKYLEYKINEQSQVIYNLRHENEDLKRDIAAEMALKIEFTLKYNMAHKLAQEATKKVEELMEDSKGYVKKINDQASEIIDIRELVKSKKQAINALKKEIDQIKSIIKNDGSTQMEVNYYPFNYNYAQICEFEEKSTLKQNLKRERKMMQFEDDLMKMTQGQNNYRAEIGQGDGTIHWDETKSKTSLEIKNNEGNEVVVTEHTNMRENENQQDQEGDLIEDSKIFDESLNKTDRPEKEEKGAYNNQKIQRKETEVPQYQAKLFKHDLSSIHPSMHKEIHLTEGKAFLMNCQLKQLSYWERFTNNEKSIQCTLQEELDQERAKDKQQELQQQLTAKKMLTSKTGPTLSANQGISDIDNEELDGIDAFNSQVSDDYGGMKPKIDDMKDAKSSKNEKSFQNRQICYGCDCHCHLNSEGAHGSADQRPLKNKSKGYKKGQLGKTIKKAMVDKVNRQKSLLQNENQNAELNRNFSSDQEEQHDNQGRKKIKKIKNAIDAITQMRKNQANQDQNMSYSDSGESPMINVNTNQNKVFEIETTESSPLNVKSEVESPKIQSPKTTQSGTQAGRFGKPNIRKLIKGSYTRN